MGITALIGYTLATLMGITLGLIGSGGSILTVPILVYIFKIKPTIATGYSLLVVGSTAAVGAFHYWRMGFVKISNAIIFSIPAASMVLFTRHTILPHMPDPLFETANMSISKDAFIMGLFALLMLLAARFMLRPNSPEAVKQPVGSVKQLFILILASSMIGLFIGLVGAGGGFIIIPAIIALFGLSMKQAIGTSLTIVTLNSFIGFHSDFQAGLIIDWSILGYFLSFAFLGVFIGMLLNRHMDGSKLKKLFAYLTLFIGLGILYPTLLNMLNTGISL